MDIKCVIFDLDDTLLDTFTQVKAAYQNAFDYLVSEYSLQPIQLWNNGEEFIRLARKMGSINPGETLSALLLQRGVGLDALDGNIEKAEGLFAEKMKQIRPFEGAGDAVKRLSDIGVGLGIISDGPSERQWYKINELPFRAYFGDNVWVSGDYPKYNEKPKQTMFRAAVGSFGLDPGKIAYVGDRDKDQIGANLAGMVAVRVLRGYSNLDPFRPKFEVEMPDYVIEETKQIVKIVEGDWPRFELGE